MTPFVCSNCYKYLTRFQKIKKNLQSVEKEIKRSLQERGIQNVMSLPRFCWIRLFDCCINRKYNCAMECCKIIEVLKFSYHFYRTSPGKRWWKVIWRKCWSFQSKGKYLFSHAGNSWNSVKWFVYLASSSFTSVDVHASDSQLELTFISTSGAIRKFSSKNGNLLS